MCVEHYAIYKTCPQYAKSMLLTKVCILRIPNPSKYAYKTILLSRLYYWYCYCCKLKSSFYEHVKGNLTCIVASSAVIILLSFVLRTTEQPRITGHLTNIMKIKTEPRSIYSKINTLN